MLIKPASFQREGEMEKAITVEIQQLQRERSVIPPLAGACSVHMKLPASIFRGLRSQMSVSEPNCKKNAQTCL